jgi:hypothetical protein
MTMPNVTVSLPTVALKAYFVLKEPFASYVKAILSTTESSFGLTVSSVTNMEEMFNSDGRDPYQLVYAPAGVSTFDYQEDYLNQIDVITFRHESSTGQLDYIRVPHNYVESYSKVLDILYLNKTLVVDLGVLPADMDTSSVFVDLLDLIETRLGVTAQVVEVATGSPTNVDRAEHELREEVRNNTTSVYKTTTVMLLETTHKYDQILARLQTLGISLN